MGQSIFDVADKLVTADGVFSQGSPLASIPGAVDYALNLPFINLLTGNAGTYVSYANYLAKPNRYAVTITRSFFQDDRVNFNCHAALLPGLDFKTASYRTTAAHPIELPYQHNFEDVTLGFYASEDQRERHFFYEWFKRIFDTTNGLFGFWIDYVSDIKIAQLDQLHLRSYEIQLYRAYPKAMGRLDLTYQSSDVVPTFVVNFAYERWEPIKYRPSASGGVSPQLLIDKIGGAVQVATGIAKVGSLGGLLPGNLFGIGSGGASVPQDQIPQRTQMITSASTIISTAESIRPRLDTISSKMQSLIAYAPSIPGASSQAKMQIAALATEIYNAAQDALTLIDDQESLLDELISTDTIKNARDISTQLATKVAQLKAKIAAIIDGLAAIETIYTQEGITDITAVGYVDDAQTEAIAAQSGVSTLVTDVGQLLTLF